MSLLAPLYFFVGALAVGFPILFHLIRRQPKGQIEFSSLMFLRPTPPRLTRRSRLDNWLLLLLRALALTLLAAAFARPFLRSASLSDAELPGRHLVLVVDTSASMQRAGLWQQALDAARDVIDDLQPADRLAIVTFDRHPKSLLGFDQSVQLSPAQLKATATKLLRDTTPSWHQTDLGHAISFAGDLAVTYEPDDETKVGLDDPAETDGERGASRGPGHLILITDMQSGSKIESLQAYAWPKELRLDVRKIAPQKRTNGAARILAKVAGAAEQDERVRVRVTNSSDATESRFRIRWSGGQASNAQGVELPVQVPPGQSRVVRMPLPKPGVTELILQGDDHSFDNTRYIVSPQPESLKLLHLGPETGEPRESLFYYLRRVPLSNDYRTVAIETITPEKLLRAPEAKEVPFIVLESAAPAEAAAHLKSYVESGGKLMVVMSDANRSAGAIQSIKAITGAELDVTEASVDDYVMFSKIDFRSTVFESMSDPKFNDFTKIRFWSHRKVSGFDDAWKIVASFDDGDPALAETQLGDGRIFLLTAGWQPEASQLALSTKFIPFVFSLFDSGRGAGAPQQYVMGEAIAMQPTATATITGPAGTATAFRTAKDGDAIDVPGVYQYRDGDVTRSFAVNLAQSESQTEPMDEGELERFGVVLGKNVTTEQARESQRQLRDQELERKQKLWQWLLVVVLGILGLETFLGMIRSRRQLEEQIEPA